MTTKEIAKATGKDITTVQRWVKKMDGKMQSVDGKMQSSTSTNPADFDLTETIAIIETGMGKNAADLYRMSAKEASTPATNTEVAQLGVMVANLCLAVGEQMKMLTAQQQQISAILAKPQERAMLPAPQLDPRAHIIKLVNEYTARTGIPHKDAYTMLYREYGYRTHCNAILSANNRGMKIIDYIDSEGQIETLEAIACEVLG